MYKVKKKIIYYFDQENDPSYVLIEINLPVLSLILIQIKFL